jgi:glycosyltransferase involved in cell wall biosynthesis
MERLTVLLPARNAERTIHGAANSVLRGLPHDASLLILDDASDDATGEIVKKLARNDGRVGVITSDVNLGVAAALNVLIDAADTELIARMDADDISLPWRFRQQIRALHREKLDAIFSPIVLFGPPPILIRPYPPLPTSPTALPYELLLMNPYSHPTLLGRRSAFVDTGGYRLVPAEDWDLWIRMVLRGLRLAKSSVTALLYRKHHQQITADEAWKSNHANSVESAEAHQELSKRLLGFDAVGAFAALGGSSAGSREIAEAVELVKAVRRAASSFRRTDRLSMRWTAGVAAYKLRRRYGADV